MKNSMRALILVLCVGSSMAAAQPGDKASKPAAPAAAMDAVGAIKVVDAGAEPRRELRYAVTKGDTFGFEVRMKITMSMKLGENAMPAPGMPAMVMAGDMKIVDVLEGGNAKVEFVYGAGRLEETQGLMPQVVAAMEKSMSQMAGLKGEYVFSPTGEYVSGSFNIPDTMDATAKQTLQGLSKSMRDLVVPLPKEPVGKGARWLCERKQESNGVEMNATYTQQLTELTPSGFTATVSVKGEAPSQTIKGQKLESMKMTSEGTQQMSLSRPVPTDAKLNSHIDMLIDAGDQGKMSMIMDALMEMKQAEAGKATKPAASTPGSKPDAAKPDSAKPAPKF